MDPGLYKAATQGSVHALRDLVAHDPNILLSVTPQYNTVLHIAARLGRRDFAEEILRERSTLIAARNAEDDTPLHVAARAGHLGTVTLLINCAVLWPEEEPGPLRMPNKDRNTPLHEAVRHRNSEIAMKLLCADPGVGHLPNGKRETPLHVAAREGLVVVVREILQQPCVEGIEEVQPPPNGTGSPLHQAVLGGHISIVKILLDERSDLMKVVDDSGNNAVHYAAQKNSRKMVKMLLRREPSFAYLTNHMGRSPLHVAAAYGSTTAIIEILRHCPYAAEQVDLTGMNALHLAVMNRTAASLRCLLWNIQPVEIINQVDASGNTPLHLAAKQVRVKSSLLLLQDKRVDPCIVNADGLTARSIIESSEEMDAYEVYICTALKRSEAERCKKQPLLAVSSSFRKKMTTANERFKSSAETYMLVAVLIATVTFSATFTMPGGFDQTTGMALLVEHTAFKVFVVSNTVAMCSSLVVVFCFIWSWKNRIRVKLILWGQGLTIVAFLAMLVAVMTAVYQVVADQCRWLAVMVCVICCTAPLLVWYILS